MDKGRKDDLLALLQVEAHHRQRIDSIWTQFKDAMLAIHGAVFAVLAALLTQTALTTDGRVMVVALTVALELMVLIPARFDVETSAAQVQADYAADYRALTGNDPPRPLYSRALTMRKKRGRSSDGTAILPPDAQDANKA